MNLAQLLRDPGEDWPYTPNELPAVFGAPANTSHPLSRRIAYGCTALLIGLTGLLGNSLVVVNLPQLQGTLGLYADEIAWLPAAYVMAIIPMNLLLVKFRAQFGLRLFVAGSVAAYALIMLAHLFAHSFASGFAVRAASGVVGTAFTTQSIFYMGQALPMKWRLHAIIIGIAIPQLALPLARCLFSTELLAFGEWRSLYLCEFGLTLLSLAAVLFFTLPPAPRHATYEKRDVLTFVLYATGGAAATAVVGLGRYLWWRDTPWLGYSLAAAIPLVTAAMLVERHRAHPLFDFRLLTAGPFLRFVALSLLLQVGIAEQTIGAVGLLNAAGLNNDQLHPLFWLVTLSMLVGVLASSLLLKPERFAYMVTTGFAIIAVAAALDSQATNLTRPEQLYFTQALIGFATVFTMGPLFLYGLRLALPLGPSAFISFLAVFSITANLGSLGASSLVGTYEIFRQKAYSHNLVQHVVPTDPQVITRMQAAGEVYRPLTADPVLRQAEGNALVGQTASHEATILAYLDVFHLICLVATLTAAHMLGLIVLRHLRTSQAATQSP
jgi:MFS family permease